MKASVLYIALLISLSSYGQISFINDTIRIDEVFVKSSLLSSPSGGYKLTTIDSATLKDYNLGNLSEIISGNTPLFIKSYGLGGISTISVRGTGASHTQLAWNGININSPMLGQADISLIPAGFLEDIRIFHGAASMSLNCGGLGGIINLETKPQWKNGSNLSVNLGLGSFDRYSGMIKARVGSGDFQTVTKACFQSADNDFIFLNTVNSNDPVYERRRNAQVNQMAFMQELYFRGEKSVTSARIWYQTTKRDLPASMLVQQTGDGERQLDEFFRTMIDYNHYDLNTDYDMSLSWFSDRLDYFNPVASIESRNHSNTIIARGGIETALGEKTKVKFVLNNELNSVRSVNYNDLRLRNVTTFTTLLRRTFGEKVGAVLLIREILNDRDLLVPDFSSGLDIRPLISRDYYLKFNFSRNSRVPSLNDLYWNPGGNPDLKNEYSYTGEVSWVMQGNIISRMEYNADITLFSNNIKDMIQWSPSQFSYWSPTNLGNVKTSGFEAGMNLVFKTGHLTFKINGQYALTEAHIIKSDQGEDLQVKQLVYVPRDMLNTGIRVSYKNLYSSWVTCFTGKRFLNPENSQYLPDYTLNNFVTGVTIKSGKNSFDVNLKVDNIFGVDYQAIAYNPMPRRSFMLSVSYQINR